MLAANYNFVIFAAINDDIVGLLFSMVILLLAGVEVSLGLSVIILYYRLRGLISVSFMVSLKG